MSTDLQELARRWRIRLERALMTVCNRRRANLRKPPYTSVHFPKGDKADLYLLNLRVWCLRYGVAPEFILETLLRRFRNQGRLVYVSKTGYMLWAISPPLLAGHKACEAVEEAVGKAYPSGENWQARNAPSLILSIPHTQIDPDNPFASARRYGAKIERIRKEQLASRAVSATTRRNFRRENFRST